MSAVTLLACCCGGQCFRLAPRCACSPDGPPVAVRCSTIIDLLESSETDELVFDHGDVCYFTSLDQPQVDPFATDPPLELVIPLYRLPTCEDCCCWRELTLCECSDGPTPLYMRCGPDVEAVKIDDACYIVGPQINSLPPGAIIVEPSAVYDSCEECCPPCNSTECCDCAFCIPILSFDVSNISIQSPDQPPCCAPSSASIPAIDNCGCEVLPGSSTVSFNIACGNCQCTYTAQGSVVCNPVDATHVKFIASVTIQPPAAFCIGSFCSSCSQSVNLTWESPIQGRCTCPPISGWNLIFKSSMVISDPVLVLTKAA